ELTRLAITDDGVLGAIDARGEPWYRVPGDVALRPGSTGTSAPSAVTAAGSLIAWGYTDGSVVVLDSRTGEEWRLYGHRAPVAHVFLQPTTRRLVSIGGNDVRVWNIPPHALKRDALRLGCIPFNMALNASKEEIALDCSDGTVSVVERATNRLTRLHRHDVLGFGVAFIRDRVCSSGWDGRVLCTRTDGSDSRVVATHSQPVRWVAGSDVTGALAYAVADGGVWLVPQDGAPR